MAKSSKLTVVDKEVKPVFNPQESYQWQAEDVFAISGLDLDILNKAFQSKLQTEEGQQAVLLVRGAEILQKVIREGVEEGIIKPAPKKEAASQ